MKITYSLDFEGPDEKPRRFAVFATLVEPRLMSYGYTLPEAIGWARTRRLADRLLKCLKASL